MLRITPGLRGPQLKLFVDMILESFDSWLDFEFLELIFVIPIYQIRAHASHNSQYMEDTEYPRIKVEIMIRDSRIST